MADINRELEEMAELTQRVNKEFALFGQLTRETAEELQDAKMKEKYGVENYTKVTRIGAEAVGALGKAAKAAAGAALEGSKKASSMNGAFDQLTESAKFAAVGLSLLIPGSALMKGVYAGITLLATTALDAANKYREVAVKISDQLYEGYSTLAQSGAAASDGMIGLFEDAKKLGYSMGELAQYTQLIGENSKDLALFGGSVSEGRKQFADMGKSFEKYSGDLIAAGFTQVQINEGLMGYTKLQTRLGQSQGKTSNELAEGARKYLIEMDGLSKLTGQTRKEMEDQQAAALMEEQYAAKIRQLTLEGNKDAVDALKKMNNAYSAAGEGVGRAFRASVTGNLSNVDAQKYNIASQGEMVKSTQAVIKGQMDWKDAVTSTGQKVGKFSDTVGTTLGQFGAYENFAGSIGEQQRLRLMTEEGITERMGKIAADAKKQGITGDKPADDAVAAQVRFQKAMQKSNEEIERLFVPGMAAATDAATIFATSAEGVAERMNKLFGIKPSDVKETEAAKAAEKAAKESAAAARSAEKTAQDVLKNNKSTKEEKKAAMQNAWSARKAEQEAVNPGPVILNKKSSAPSSAAPSSAAPTAPSAGAPTTRGLSTRPSSAAPVNIGGPDGGHATQEVGGAGDDGKPKLARVSSASGKSTSVNAQYAPAFQGLLDYLGKVGYEVTSLGGYVDRDVRGKPGVKSIHAHGAAIDINPGANPLSNTLVTDMPPEIASIAASFGLGWGGNWKTRKDAMHFSAAQSEGGSLLKARDGGMFQGPTSGYNVELHGKEAVIPLKDGAVPVSLNLKDALSGPTFAGSNEYAGYNQGAMSTDLDAVKKIAAAAGAFDRATETITNPEMWKQVLSSGLATNYQLGAATLGTKGIEGLGDDIAARLKEIQEQSGADSTAALQQVTTEFKTAMSQMSQQLAEMAAKQNGNNMGGVTELLSELISATKSGVSVQQKILASSH